MDISAEQFRQIVADCRRQAGEGKRRSPRIGVRYTVTVRPAAHESAGAVPLAPPAPPAAAPGARPLIDIDPDAPLAEPGVAITSRLRDVSANGVGLTCRAVILGFFTLEMPDSAGRPCAQRCRTVRCRQVGPDQFQIGAAFVE